MSLIPNEEEDFESKSPEELMQMIAEIRRRRHERQIGKPKATPKAKAVKVKMAKAETEMSQLEAMLKQIEGIGK